MNEVFQRRLAPRKRLPLLRRISSGRWIASGLQRATDNPVRGDPPVAGSAFCGDPVKRGTTCRKFCKGCSAGSRDKPEKSIRGWRCFAWTRRSPEKATTRKKQRLHPRRDTDRVDLMRCREIAPLLRMREKAGFPAGLTVTAGSAFMDVHPGSRPATLSANISGKGR